MEDSRFKNSQGSFFTTGLFFETCNGVKDHVMYTLKDHDRDNYPSLRLLYIDTADDTEYTFATTHLGGWSHFKLLQSKGFFMDYLSKWREELQAKNSSVLVSTLREKALKGDARAAQYLLEKWADRSPVGRPSKESVLKEARKISRDHDDIEADLNRMKEFLTA